MSSTEYRESEPFTQVAIGPLAAWRRQWVKGTVAALIGAVVGVAVGFAMPVSYTAESRVAVGAGDLTSGAVAGFPLAASGLASNYARYVNDRGVAQTDVPEGVTLSASQIPESNVIRIEAVSADSAAATAAANTAAEQLVNIVNTNGRQSIDAAFADFSEAAKNDAKNQTQLAAAQRNLDQLLNKDGAKKAAIQAARDKVTQAAANAANTSAKSAALRQKYTNLVDGGKTAANLQLIRTADALKSNRMSRVSQLGLLGLIVGAAAGLVIALRIERRGTSTARTANEKATGRHGE
ncbi:MAG: hypothetical protein QM582_01455 [Micropruina sp.]|uniref:hypothetical protein n=1 Tax=Micropruina sp. TaxID=2737536 RepID=UPI0039E60A1B